MQVMQLLLISNLLLTSQMLVLPLLAFLVVRPCQGGALVPADRGSKPAGGLPFQKLLSSGTLPRFS